MTASGKFTVGTAWELLRSKAVKSDVFKNMWISGVPFKISFFFWRLWKYKIPVGEVVKRIGVDTEARFYCCDHRQYETVDHLFVTGNISKKVWTYVKTAIGITTQFQQVKQILQIWKWRNKVLHGGKMSINKVIYEINMIIYQMCRMRFLGQNNLPRCIPQILQVFEAYRPRIVSKMVKWEFPMPGWFKCNSVGASRVISSLQQQEGYQMAEARALHKGLKYCVTNSLLPMVMETDSMTMEMVLNGQWDTPWSMSMIINNISRLRRDKEVRVEHVLKEGNGLANYLTNYAFDFAGDHHFHSFASLPVKARKILNTENPHIPYMRIRTAKDHHIPGD
ncbi:uncharacterized protein LOC132607783 [Lycium barbarum]|uniref:uncharacterized protein LOC132607783 n=1 Tax=Lycium barbarum TaxID=112863 RepID=UPI00293E9F38|nr:uncharacterized protein LOC132607783 [Lycium barbarum]